VTYLDTHAAIWLRDGDHDAFEKRSQRAIAADDVLLISPMVVLELQILYEKNKVVDPSDEIVGDLVGFGVRICDYPFPLVVEKAVNEEWTRDPFDRIITAHARARRAALVTHDALIRANYDLALW